MSQTFVISPGQTSKNIVGNQNCNVTLGVPAGATATLMYASLSGTVAWPLGLITGPSTVKDTLLKTTTFFVIATGAAVTVTVSDPDPRNTLDATTYSNYWVSGLSQPLYDSTGALSGFLTGTVKTFFARTLFQGGIPFVLPSSGSMAANGALTVTTALASEHLPTAGSYVSMPAGAVFAGSTAGWYYGEWSSTTTCTLFQNTYVSGQPSLPGSSKIAVNAAGPGAYTQTLNNVAWLQATVPANVLGNSGYLRLSTQMGNVNNGNNKQIILNIAGNAQFSATQTESTSTDWMFQTHIAARGVQNVQASYSGSEYIRNLGNNINPVDFTQNRVLTLYMALSVATDYMIGNTYLLEMIPGV